jgi:DNA polymerase III delta prime subunit
VSYNVKVMRSIPADPRRGPTYMSQTYLIIGTEEQTLAKYTEFLEKEQVSPFDTTTISLEKSIGIEDIRAMQQKLYLSTTAGKKKAITLFHAETLTVEAQNALLKTLEEPPGHALIFLLAADKSNLLPTVLSRCTVIELANKQDGSSARGDANLTLLEGSIKEALALAEKAKTKEDALLLLTELIIATRNKLLEGDTSQKASSIHTLRTLQKSYTLIQTTNVQPRFVLEVTFLSL